MYDNKYVISSPKTFTINCQKVEIIGKHVCSIYYVGIGIKMCILYLVKTIY